jgi:hypothetical protein
MISLKVISPANALRSRAIKLNKIYFTVTIQNIYTEWEARLKGKCSGNNRQILIFTFLPNRENKFQGNKHFTSVWSCF